MTLVDKNQAEQILKDAKKILIAPSSPMDGDSVGSSLALAVVLRKMGKEVKVVSYDLPPDYLKFLPYVSQIESELTASKDFVISLSTDQAEVEHLKYEVEQGKINIIVTPKTGRFTAKDLSLVKEEEDYDLIVTVDTGDMVQLGKLPEEHKDLFARTPILNIDHHASNGKFGTYNLLEYGSAATTQIITPMIMDFEKERGEEFIDEDIATLLLVGIITDTGSFQHTNTTPEAFEVAADLLDRGARQQEIIKHIFKTKSLATLKLWGRVLERITYDQNAKLVYSYLTLKDLEETGASPDDTGGIIDELMTSAPGAEVVMLLKEKEPGFVSGSLRAPGQIANVDEVAKLLGGGGHKKAAGFRIRNKSIEEAVEMGKQAVYSYMSQLGVANVATAIEPKDDMSGRLFPGLTAKPQTVIPKPSKGGEDMLLEDFRKRQNQPVDTQEQNLKEKTARFFQDADGQIKPEDLTVEDILSQLGE